MTRAQGWLGNVKIGIWWGLWLAFGCSLMLGAVSMVAGAPTVQRHFGHSVRVLAAGYFVAGVVIGGLVGAVLSLVRSESAARVVGFLAGALAGAAGVPVVVPRRDWFPGGLIGVLVIAIGIGAPLGATFWERSHKDAGG